MTETVLSWGCCNARIGDDEYVQCSKCNVSYHCGCLGIEFNTTRHNWNCPKCCGTKPKGVRSDETPVRSSNYRSNAPINETNVTKRSHKRQALSSPTSPNETASITQEQVRIIISEVIEKEISSLIDNIKKTITSSISTHLKTLETKIEDLQQSVSFMSNQYDDMKKQVDSYSEITLKLQHENQSLQSAVLDLSYKVNQMEQRARANNIEIQCVPESKNENLISIVKQLSNTVGSNIEACNIQNCTRTAKMNRNSTRPRSIILQLNSPSVRDQLLAAVIKFNKKYPTEKLNSSHLGIGGNTVPVYVCEHLSAANKLLHAATRRKAKELKYRHVWVRNGRIFVRKTDNSDYKIIYNMDCLDKLN